ncbi:FAD dependent oxidoreductase [Vararia minispora EC-137]|uniref:FAD dependent oxidoreductase n=1 Tax=Vararia minispora EC-137 TaxID=1314806 RepID=A0ACB8Q5F7_9AGAM|nr:FAD dependent oxidoreductase [Vararia minispora EC-137]
MGSVISRALGILKILLDLKAKLDGIEGRLKCSPGVPVSCPTTPFWMIPPSSIADYQSPFPPHADVVIIGSGITGTALARTILDYIGKESLSVVMLEARTTCSGATGRNGGHINPPLYTDYVQLKEEFGRDMAKRIIRWRLSHLYELQRVAFEEGALEFCQIREVDCLDVYYSKEEYAKAKELLAAWREDMPEEAQKVYSVDDKEAKARLGFGDQAVGVIVAPGGAVHPYRLVTSTLSNLLKRHSDRFFFSTHTPCTDISLSSSQAYYTVHTPRGILTTPHIIHATNGWSPHLLPGLLAKAILPFRGHMSAQRPGKALAHSFTPGSRAYVFHSGNHGYDYLTQLPSGEHELMFGGGFLRNGQLSLSEVGEVNDGGIDVGIASHVAGALPIYFGLDSWGPEAEPVGDVSLLPLGRVKSLWTGVIAASVDGQPWVGRVPSQISRRKNPSSSLVPKRKVDGSRTEVLTAAPGEWMAVGFTGEGMVNAWQSGRSLAYILLGVEKEEKLEEWFPEVMLVSEQRWRKASIGRLLEKF